MSRRHLSLAKQFCECVVPLLSEWRTELEFGRSIREDIDTVFGVNCPPWLTDLKQTPKLTWWMTASAGFDHLLQKPFFSKASLGNEIPFVFTTNSGTHAGAIPRESSRLSLCEHASD